MVPMADKRQNRNSAGILSGSEPSVVDFAGRGAFLLATERCWKPSPLSTLTKAQPAILGWLETQQYFREAFEGEPEARKWWVGMSMAFPLQPHYVDHTTGKRWDGTPLNWASVTADPSLTAVTAADALNHWRDQYGIAPADTWILDAAIGAVACCAWTNRPLEWLLPPPRELRESFNFTVSWSKIDQARDSDSMASFQDQAVKDFRHALARYCAKVRVHRGDGKGTLRRDARWTAYIFAGASESDILDARTCTGRQVLSDGTGLRAVHRFAARIGLTLPSVGTFVGTPEQKRAQFSAIWHYS